MDERDECECDELNMCECDEESKPEEEIRVRIGEICRSYTPAMRMSMQ